MHRHLLTKLVIHRLRLLQRLQRNRSIHIQQSELLSTAIAHGNRPF